MFDSRSKTSQLLELGYFRCLLFVVAVGVTFSLLSPYFLSWSNIDNILSASTVIGILAIGVTFVIGTGGIDLSIASVMALSGTVCAVLIKDYSLSTPFTPLVCVAVGGLCGLLTGALINITKAPSFIVSLGMLSIARAIAYLIADGMPVYGLPGEVTFWGQGKFLALSVPVIILLGAAGVAYLILHKTVLGAHALVYGDTPSAAEMMGIPVSVLKLKIYGTCGLFAGLAGFVFMARTNAGDPNAGQNYELMAITAVILGGTKLFGGYANILGTLLGVLCLGILQNGLNLLAVSTYYQVLFVGIVLIGAALVERLGESR